MVRGLSDLVTIALLPSPLRSPVQIIAAGDAVQAFLVTADARQLVTSRQVV